MGTSAIAPRACGELVETYLKNYGHYVAEERAISSLFDGLKPVQRRILWAAWTQLGLRPAAHSKKSARLTGEVTGKYHPHGTAACYESIVKLTWQRYPMLEGKGNFGLPWADLPAAAERYTEVKASTLLQELFRDNAITPLEDTYSGENKEPTLLPTRLPLLLLNGSEGIAVSILAKIPPHNLEEVVKTLLLYLRAKPPTTAQVLATLKGPDYPEGGELLSGLSELKALYETGLGSLTYACQYTIATDGKDAKLTVTSGCPNWSLNSFLSRCVKLQAEGKIKWANNESHQDFRVSVCAKSKEALNSFVVPLLTRKVHYTWIALDAKRQPKAFTLHTYCQQWVGWRIEVVEKRIRHELASIDQRLFVERAKLKALRNPAKTVKLLQNANPLSSVMAGLQIDKEQAEVILGMSLRSLTPAGKAAQEKQVGGLTQRKARLKEQLTDIPKVVKHELIELKTYFDDRRTLIKTH